MNNVPTGHRKLLLAACGLVLSYVLSPLRADPPPYEHAFVQRHNNLILQCGRLGECECNGSASSSPTLPSPIYSGGPGLGGGSAGGTLSFVDNSCTWVLIGTGNPALGSILPSDFFRVWAETPLASLYTPAGLQYVRGGYGMEGFSREKTAGGVPRQVTVINPQGLEVDYRFADNESIGKPQSSTEELDRSRLVMTDAEGWATTNQPAYYDLYTGGGDLYRFVAATNSEDFLDLKLYTSVRGRVEDASSWVTDVIRDDNHVLRQVKSATSLADIVAVNDHKYSIAFYRLADVLTGKDTNGYYQVANGSTPLVTWTMENPEPATLKKLRVSKTLGTKTSTFDYVYIDASSEWQLTSGDGLLVKTSDQIWNEARTTMLHTIVERDSGDKVLGKTVTRYDVFPWWTERTEKIVDPDGQALKTEYAYYDNSAEGYRYGKLKSKRHPDGSWESYDYNSSGYRSVAIRPWKDSAFGSSAQNARATYSDYTPVAAGDSLVFNDQRPRTVTEKILGVTVSKTFHAYVTNAVGELSEIVERCTATNAAFGDPSSLRTTTTYYGTNVPSFKVTLPKSVQFPDGRLDNYDYQYGTFHGSNSSPQDSWFEIDAIGADLMRTVTHGTTNNVNGLAGKTTRNVTVFDQYSRGRLSEEWVFTGGTNYVRIAWSMPEYDDYFHVTRLHKSDGTMEEASWGSNCCGKEFDKDAAGIEKSYGYDLLNHLTSVTKKGANSPADDVTTSYVLDPLGRQLSTTLTGGTLSLVTESNAYNTAGELLSTVDAQGLTTTYSEAGGGLTNDVIHPGGLTNTTVRYLDGRTQSTIENGVIKTWNDFGANQDGTQWTLTCTGPAGTNSPMWAKTTTDLLGRTVREEKPAFGGGTITNAFFYNAVGQLVRATSPGVADTVYAFDELGRQIRQGRVEGGVTNWLSGSEELFEAVGSNVWQTQRSLVFPVDNDMAVTTAVQRVLLSGLGTSGDSGILTAISVTEDIRGNETTSRTTVNRGAKVLTQAVEYPDSTNAAHNVTSNGLLRSSLSKTGVRTDYAWDVLERQTEARTSSAGGPRSVASVTAYNSKGQVAYTEDAASNRTWFAYDPDTARRIAVTNALGVATYTAYDLEGHAVATWGATYPVAYEFDAYGRMIAMATTRDTALAITNLLSLLPQGVSLFDVSNPSYPSNSLDTTRWLYDEATGLLTNKVYADGNGTAYTYTQDGKLVTRTWARGIVTTYSWDLLGQMTNIDYSGSAPNVSFAFNRLGQQLTITDGQGPRTFTYSDFLQLAAETNVFGAITRAYDSFGRSSGFDLSDASSSVRYSYSDVGRFSSVSSSVFSVTSGVSYSYLPGSDLVQNWMPTTSGVTFTRSYEANCDLLTSVTNVAGGLLVSAFDYQNDSLGRRMQRIDAGSVVATNAFAYDSRSQLTNALLNGGAFAWTFDPIGNRQTDTSNSVTHVYAANALNQYTTITNGGIRTLAFDLDGNLTNDGQFAYAWDGENRLTGASNGATVARYDYDYQSRRSQKVVGSTTNLFFYDGWNLVREISYGPWEIVTNVYCWGLDLSGTLQGAGGIGGLLAVIRNGVPYYPCYDANGNITDYVNASGTVVAHREYDAYGATVVSTGPMKDAFSLWFSTKYWDTETGLGYWGARYYKPEWGRWLSRDPIGEEGFKLSKKQSKLSKGIDNELEAWQHAELERVAPGLAARMNLRPLMPQMQLYVFCANSPIDRYDVVGLDWPANGNPFPGGDIPGNYSPIPPAPPDAPAGCCSGSACRRWCNIGAWIMRATCATVCLPAEAGWWLCFRPCSMAVTAANATCILGCTGCRNP